MPGSVCAGFETDAIIGGVYTGYGFLGGALQLNGAGYVTNYASLAFGDNTVYFPAAYFLSTDNMALCYRMITSQLRGVQAPPGTSLYTCQLLSVGNVYPISAMQCDAYWTAVQVSNFRTNPRAAANALLLYCASS